MGFVILQSTIHDLFEVREEAEEFRPGGEEITEIVKEVHLPQSVPPSRAISPSLVAMENVFETALNAAEEDDDAKAASVACAEARAELAEFEEGSGENVEPVSKQEMELKQVMGQVGLFIATDVFICTF